MISEHDDRLTNTDPAEAVQGHVGQSVKQQFAVELARPVRHPKLRIEAYEFVLKDQFGNKYFLHRAMLFDGELYDVVQWFEKGGLEPMLVKEFKRFPCVNDACIDFARDTAFLAFGRTNKEILKARRKSSNPVGLEPKDVRYQSLVLTKALEAAGHPTQKEPFDAMKLLTPEKVEHTPPLTNGIPAPANNVLTFPPPGKSLPLVNIPDGHSNPLDAS